MTIPVCVTSFRKAHSPTMMIIDEEKRHWEVTETIDASPQTFSRIKRKKDPFCDPFCVNCIGNKTHTRHNRACIYKYYSK